MGVIMKDESILCACIFNNSFEAINAGKNMATRHVQS